MSLTDGRRLFQWDPAKEKENLRKHGVSFAQAKALLVSEQERLETYDDEHSVHEDRFITIGPRAKIFSSSFGRSAVRTPFESSAPDWRPRKIDASFTTRWRQND